MTKYANPVVTYRVGAPWEPQGPAATPVTYPNPVEAWRAAVVSVIDGADTPGNDDRWQVVRHMLDCNDADLCWGWAVTRWAKTYVQNQSTGMDLTSTWNGALRMDRGPGLDAELFEFLVVQAVNRSAGRVAGVDVVVATDTLIVIGIAVAANMQEITFVDGHTVPLEDVVQVVMTYGALGGE